MGKYAEYCTDGEHYGLIKVKVREYLTLEEAQQLFDELDEALCQAGSDKREAEKE
jgi:hypothetical protein